jgi:cell division protein FtsB
VTSSVELLDVTFHRKGILKLSVFLFLFLSLVVGWLGFGERGFVHLYRMDKERQVRLEKARQLERENKELLDEIERLRTDKEYLESLGRRELGLIKEGEILYRFSPGKKKESLSAKQRATP